MLVYHFTDAKTAMLILRGRKLKVSRFSELNDPFELQALNLKSKLARRAMSRTFEQVDADRGIICFSKDWSNPVQWAHYADRHRGICLGFELPADWLREVVYIEHRVAEDDFRRMIENGDDEALVNLSFSKFSHWAYEQEVRTLCTLEDPEDDGGHYVYFHQGIRLREIIVGARNMTSTKRELRGAANGIPTLKIFKARAAFQTFTMTRQMNAKLGVPG